MKVAIVYASTHGHTGKIAGRLAEVLRGEGLGGRPRSTSLRKLLGRRLRVGVGRPRSGPR